MLSNFELRVDLFARIANELGTTVGCKFDKRFYMEMMWMKYLGVNLWFSDEEEKFYREECGE